MDKLILMSVMAATVILPTLSARGPNPVRSAKRAVVLIVLFDALYVMAVAFVYVRNYIPVWDP
jgi:hypothetical protein